MARYIRIDLTDQSFGRLTALEDVGKDKHGNRLWQCKCSCGRNTTKPASNLLRGHTTSCGCLKEQCGPESLKWTGQGLISGRMWAQIKNNAKSRNHTFELSLEQAWRVFQDQGGKCAISGVLIEFQESKYARSGTASLDRKDSSKGYDKDNVQWVHKTINIMKNTLTDEEFIWWCKAVALNQGELY